uniref:Putative ATPase domain containing protein n=1 Tax=viral metagenome TaxID=1070528 RepID=A0A6M3KF53_9ZZZZ
MKIIRLEVENIKRLQAIEITPTGNLVVIGGKNGEGKTSALDSIAYTLGGKALIPSEPIRRGAKKAKATVNLGEFVVTRTFTQGGGGTLKITGRDGTVYSSPQRMLDDFKGRLTFDPLEFAGMKPADQLDTLKQIVGLDFTEMDATWKRLYNERMLVNRDLKNAKTNFEKMLHYNDLPDEKVSVKMLMANLQAAEAKNGANNVRRQRLVEIESRMTNTRVKIAELWRQIEEFEKFMTKLKKEHSGLEDEVLALEDTNENAIRDQISSAEATNQKIQANLDRVATQALVAEKQQESDRLTAEMSMIDLIKTRKLSEAKFPITGLAFDESGVIYQGLPFEQASGAEKLRVSVAMGLAMNPKLNVLLIRDGSLLDADNLEMVARMAEVADAQVWIERVGDGAECQVIIENGKIRNDKDSDKDEEDFGDI